MTPPVFRYVDGLPARERELTVVPRTQYPFKGNPTPDVYSRLYERDYIVAPLMYIPRSADRYAWTNRLTYSEQLNNAAWTKANLTVTPNTGTAPDGEPTFDEVAATVANDEHSAAQSVVGASALPTEVSIFAKGTTALRWIRVAFTDSAATVFSGFFDIAAGATGTKSAGVTSQIVRMGGGIFRCVIRFTPAAGAGSVKVNLSDDGAAISYVGNPAFAVHLWGAQFSVGIATPYISTTDVLRSILAPERDKSDPLAYLLQEEEPVQGSSEAQIIRRLFGRVPRQQVVPDSLFVTKPAISGDFPQAIGAYVVSQPVSTVAKYDGYLTQAVSGDSGALLSPGPVSGGTYTLSFDGDTTAAIAFDATAGAVQTALNALGSITDRGGVTVTGDYATGFAIVFAAYAAPSVNTAGLTGTGPFTGLGSGAGGVGNYAMGIDIYGTGSGITGGTFTITIFGQTTAGIAYNSSAAGAAAAINALSNVAARGGVHSSGSPNPIVYGPGQIGVGWGFSNPPITVNGAGLLPVGGGGTSTPTDPTGGFISQSFYGRLQTLTFTGVTVGNRIATTAAPHGITIADAIYARAGDNYFLIPAGSFSVSDTDEITFNGASGSVAVSTSPITEIGKREIVGYAPGLAQTRCNRVTDYFLPGVTPGIDVAEDIPLPIFQGDPATLITAIFSGLTNINYDVGQLVQYRNTPILARTVIQLNAATL